MTVDRDRGLQAFRDRLPALAEALAQVPGEGLDPIVEEGVLVDLSLSGKRLYGQNGKDLFRRQVDAFLATPFRLVIESPNSVGLGSPLALGIGEAMNLWLTGHGISSMPVMPHRGRTFLFVYGIGLGHELERLVTEVGAQFVVFVEPMVEVLSRSLETVDWEALFDALDERGAVYQFITHDRPDAIHAVLRAFVMRNGNGFLDGAYVFQHHTLWSLTEAKRLLREEAFELFLAPGFFEDEEVMLRNTIGNFATVADGRLLDGAPRVERHEPIFVVGSGPSLDQSIDVIKHYRDKALVISSGTALSLLLRHGVMPDYHVELENGDWVYNIISRISREYDLSSIRFLGSTSVDPRVAPLFSKASFYLRDAISSTKVFRGNLREVPLCSPTCVNAAFTSFTLLGFRHLYLFGVDCGKRLHAGHHAQGSIYEVLDFDQSKFKYPIRLRANFGGEAFTNWIYDLSRNMLSRTIHHRGVEVFNCSDGALIDGAIPCLPESVELDSPELDRAQLLPELDRRMLPLDGMTRIRAADLTRLLEDAEDLCRIVDEMLEAAGESEDPFAEFYRLICSQTWDGVKWAQTVDAVMCGTVRAAARLGMYYGIRLSDMDRTLALYGEFAVAFGRMMREMVERLETIVDEIENKIGEPLPISGIR